VEQGEILFYLAPMAYRAKDFKYANAYAYEYSPAKSPRKCTLTTTTKQLVFLKFVNNDTSTMYRIGQLKVQMFESLLFHITNFHQIKLKICIHVPKALTYKG
jgi:hypothetical protein